LPPTNETVAAAAIVIVAEAGPPASPDGRGRVIRMRAVDPLRRGALGGHNNDNDSEDEERESTARALLLVDATVPSDLYRSAGLFGDEYLPVPPASPPAASRPGTRADPTTPIYRAEQATHASTFARRATAARDTWRLKCVAFDFDKTIHSSPAVSRVAYPYGVDWAWCRRYVSRDFVEMSRELVRCGIVVAVASYSDSSAGDPDCWAGEAFVRSVLDLVFATTDVDCRSWPVLCRYTRDDKAWHLQELLALLRRNGSQDANSDSLLLVDDVEDNCRCWRRLGAQALHVTGPSFRVDEEWDSAFRPRER